MIIIMGGFVFEDIWPKQNGHLIMLDWGKFPVP